jgi:hypothetical protein
MSAPLHSLVLYGLCHAYACVQKMLHKQILIFSPTLYRAAVIACSSLLAINGQAATPETLIQQVAQPGALQTSWHELIFSRHGKTLLATEFLVDNPFYRAKPDQPGWELEELRTVINEGIHSQGACDFPARHNWVHQQLHGKAMPFPSHCSALSKWIHNGHVASVDLLFVSGYLSNPASTFGHTLLNFRTGLGEHHRSLEDSLNYGALVPPGEGVLPYIARGLFGGYAAGFSDGAYSAHMNTYQEKELRAIWRYQLNFTEQQKLEIVYRSAELVTHKFDYYFLSENCAYAMGLMINAVAGHPYRMPDDPTWFAPIELIHKLANATNLVTGQPVVKTIEYTPPGQAVLQKRFDALSAGGQALYLNATKQPQAVLQRVRENNNLPHDADHALDAALSYWQTLNLDSGADQFLSEKEAILKARLSLPASKAFIPALAPIQNSIPHQSQRSGQFSLGFVADDVRKEQVKLKWSAFEQSDNTLHPLGVGRELSVFRFKASQSRQNSSVDEFTVLSVKSVGVPDDTGLSYLGGLMSWAVSAGLSRRLGEPDYLRKLEQGGVSGLKPVFTGAIGLSYPNANNTAVAALLLEPELGSGVHPGTLAYVARLQYRPDHEFSSTLNLRYRHAYVPVSSRGAGNFNERMPVLFAENISVFKLNESYALEIEAQYSQVNHGLGVYITKTF